jgi:hypothetical protein
MTLQKTSGPMFPGPAGRERAWEVRGKPMTGDAGGQGDSISKYRSKKNLEFKMHSANRIWQDADSCCQPPLNEASRFQIGKMVYLERRL